MFPSLADLLQLSQPVGSFMSLIGGGWLIGRAAERLAPRFGVPRPAIAAWTPLLVVVTVVSARLVAMLPHWRAIATHPLDLLRISEQLSIWGGVVGVFSSLIVLCWRARLPFWRVADTFGGAVPLGFAVHGLACLVRDDCYGRAAPPPFGIVFPGLQTARYPVALYAAALALLAYAALRRLGERRPMPGTVALTAIVAIAGGRALLAPLRLDAAAGYVDRDFVTSLGLASLALVLLQIRVLRASLRDGAASPITPSPPVMPGMPINGNERGSRDIAPRGAVDAPVTPAAAISFDGRLRRAGRLVDKGERW